MGGKRDFGKKLSTEPLLERFYMRFERLGIVKIFMIWVVIVVLFGFIYLWASDGSGALVYSHEGTVVESFLDSVYFSFITATSTGYGDIIPSGANKLVSLVEVIIGLMVFALVTSKIVGIKQERILKEIYEISLQERIQRIRSSLYLYRADLSKIMHRVEEGEIKKREVAELWTFANFFEQRLTEIKELFGHRKDRVHSIDIIDSKLVMNSVVNSFSKTADCLRSLEEHGIDWRREVTVFAFGEVCKEADEAVEVLRKTKRDNTLFLEDMELYRKERESVSSVLKNAS